MLTHKIHVPFYKGLIISIFLIFMYSPLSFSYSSYIHKKTANWVFHSLSKQDQHAIKLSIHSLNSNLFPNNFPNLSQVLDQSSFRKKTVKEVFAMAHIPVPKALIPYQNMPTRFLHYLTIPIHSSSCNVFAMRHNAKKISFLTTVIRLYPLYKNKKNKTKEDQKTQAILLLFLSHLMLDFHNPTHILSQVTSCHIRPHLSYKTDRGGNKVCLIQAPRKCIENLHHFWDQGGYDPLWSLSQKRITTELNTTQYLWQLQKKSFSHFSVSYWVSSMIPFKNAIYLNSQNIPLPYKTQTQIITRMLITLGGTRLKVILNH